VITRDDAITLGMFGGELHHVSLTQGGRKPVPLRVRVNGKCKTWKRDAQRWNLPVKHGLRECFQISAGFFPGTEGANTDWVPADPERLAIQTKRRLLAERLGVDPLRTPSHILADLAKDKGLVAADA
jgi:hypothetical protein